MERKLLGKSELRLDPKGRIVLPAKWRPPFDLGSDAFLARHERFDHCLTLWTPSQFESVVERMEELQTNGSIGDRNVARVWSSETEQVQVDRQGRVAIPQHMRTKARLDGQVMVIGVMDHVEIWDTQTWEAEVASAVPSGPLDLVEPAPR